MATLRKEVDDPFDGFDISYADFWTTSDPRYYYSRLSLKSKTTQLINYLEAVHRAREKIVEIGSVYNLIRDAELKSRCSDLLSASEHFDRVINQATQVLEERLRLKLPNMKDDVGLVLVGKAINPEPLKSQVVFSNHSSEQEGYSALFRGMVGAFRNPSHHRFLENVTREQALQICAFVDNMLTALELADIRQPNS